MRRSLTMFAVVSATCLVSVRSADAHVLVEQGPRAISCGKAIKMAVWYQTYSGGPRWAVLRVKSMRGFTVASRRVVATTSWRNYSFTPRCGRRYRVVYSLPSGSLSYVVRVGKG